VAFQNNQVLLFVIVAHAAILAWTQTKRYSFLIVSGLAIGAALLLRASSLIHVMTIGLFLLGCLAIDKTHKREGVKVLALWAAGIVPLFAVGRIFDFLRFGTFLTTGQTVWLQHINDDPIFTGLPLMPAHFPFTGDFSVGMLGVLISPAKSIFLYDPLLVPCLLIAAFSWRQLTPHVRLFIGAAALNLFLHMIFTSRLEFWHGDWAWGARYHVTSVDLLLIPLVPTLIRSAFGAPLGRAWLARTILALAVAVQLLAVSMEADEEIMVEALQDYSTCDAETWDAPLGFRLGMRLESLYCLASGSRLSSCPSAIGAEALRAHPSCAASVEGLQHSTRLAFFPFDPFNKPLVARIELLVWAITLSAAFGVTAAWLRSVRRLDFSRR
jgi:hypothetical protein